VHRLALEKARKSCRLTRIDAHSHACGRSPQPTSCRTDPRGVDYGGLLNILRAVGPARPRIALMIWINVTHGRLGLPADTAALVSFLCSADGGWINGQLLHSDGGLHA
jgi:NAD(P)-dependent dehydrogenase (short-subunit alcohol dehydrogenase family)